jgi:aryl-alcohol dehydrogenase-like predicted oxidoreductase
MDVQQSFSVTLGKSDIKISPMGLGTWAWGDKMVWAYGNGYTDDDIEKAYHVSLSGGINFLDTAEIYGRGISEKLIGTFLRQTDDVPVIATKFMPYPWRVTKNSLRDALNRSLERLGLDFVHLYQVHWPFPPKPVRFWMDALADVVEDGLVKGVGVSNYSRDQMLRSHEQLAKRNIPLLSNQVEYSLLQRKPEQSGLLDACNELGITLIAYSPLAMGMLTGKYNSAELPKGLRARRYGKKKIERIEMLNGLMREIGEEHGGKTVAQVALNWTIRKGTVPIPGAKNEEQALQNAGALGWELTEEEMRLLEEM